MTKKVTKKSSPKRKKGEFTKKIENLVDNKEDYFDKLSPNEKIWMTKFNREYYDNDHEKKDSLHKEILGDDYDVNVSGKNRYGQDITLKQKMFTIFNERERDLINFCKSGGNSEEWLSNFEDEEGLNNDSDHFGSKNTIRYDLLDEDRTTINNLFKHYEPQEIIDIYRKNLLSNLYSGQSNDEELIRRYTWKILLISFKICKKEKKYKKYNSNTNQKED